MRRTLIQRTGLSPLTGAALLRGVMVFCMLICSLSCGGETVPLPGPAGLPLPVSADCVDAPDKIGCAAEVTFFAQDRRADFPHIFDTVPAGKLAESEHFVLYLETANSDKIGSTDAEGQVACWENAYLSIKEIYGAGVSPDTDGQTKIIVFALDIKDDYTVTEPAYVSGYFAPRDLFADEFTAGLVNNPDSINDYPELAAIESAASLKGRSNESRLIYIDLHPLYDGAAYGGDAARGAAIFKETVLHEAAHLATYYKRVIQDQHPNHLRWIAEGMAEQAPLLLAGSTMSQQERMTQLGLPLVQNLLADGPSLLDMNAGNSLVGYIQTNLFFNYLRHRAGTDKVSALFRSFVTGSDESVYGIDVAIGANFGGGANFAKMFADWALANWLGSTGRTLTAMNEYGTEVVDVAGRKDELSYANAGIESFGEAGLAFSSNSLPLSYDGMKELAPGAYINFSYSPVENETYIPIDSGMEPGLHLAIIRLDGISNAEISLYTPVQSDEQATVIQLTADETYHIIVFNPLYTGGLLSTGQLPWDSRNLASWIGGGIVDEGWQTGAGAAWNRNDAYFYRPSGMGLNLRHSGRSASYIYVADYINQGVSRWNIDTGEFAGRMGSKNYDESCAGDGPENDGWKTAEGKLSNNYCRRNFSDPRGIAVDSSGNIYIADGANHRIIKRDHEGNFTAWLGNPGDDTWQTVDPVKLSISTLPAALYSPWGVAIDDTDTYLYISCYGSNRIVRRDLATGAHAGFIGNGEEGWYMATEDHHGNSGSVRNYFNDPKGIALDSEYLYVADESNHRITRWTLDGYNRSADVVPDDSALWIGGGVDGWHNTATPVTDTQERKLFKYPADVSVIGTSLLVADRGNQRIVRWNRETGEFDGWIGGGKTEWEKEDNGPDLQPSNSNGAEYPAVFMLQPIYVLAATAAESGMSHDYLYTTAIYNGRVSRWNLDCVEDNINGDCSDE